MIRIYFANLPNFHNITILKFMDISLLPKFDHLSLFLGAWEVGHRQSGNQYVRPDCYVILPMMNSGCF